MMKTFLITLSRLDQLKARGIANCNLLNILALSYDKEGTAVKVENKYDYYSIYGKQNIFIKICMIDKY